MANISHFTQTVNGVSTTYDIHDAGAVPRSGGAVFENYMYGRSVSDDVLRFTGGTAWREGAGLALFGKDRPSDAGVVFIKADDGTSLNQIALYPNGKFSQNVNGTLKNIAAQEDVVPRSGGAVMTSAEIGRVVNNDQLLLMGGAGWALGASISLCGKDNPAESSTLKGCVRLFAHDGTTYKEMYLKPDGGWTWTGQAVQLVSDQRLKQQITEIDDKLLDAWQDVDLVQFKYNDAVDSKGDKARLHTGFVVQQIDSACKKHGVDISNYGLYCHEVYPEETEEVEIEQTDGTKVKETKVIREASEHYSLRYTEALIVECKYLRRCVERLTARIEELEKGNNIK